MAKTKKLSKVKQSTRKVSKKKNSKKLKPEVVALVIFASIVVLGAIVVAGTALFNQINLYNLQQQLGDEAKFSRARQVPMNDAAHKLKLDLIVSSGVIDGTTPILSERLDTCLLVGMEQGWVYTDWQQKCFTTYLDYIPTTLPKDAATTKLASVAGVAEQFGVIDIREKNRDCRIFKINYSASLRYFSVGEESDGCKKPKHVLKGEVGEIVEEPRGKTLVIKSFGDEDFIEDRAYIQVESRSNYYESTRLGCNGFMCGPPLDSAVPSFE